MMAMSIQTTKPWMLRLKVPALRTGDGGNVLGAANKIKAAGLMVTFGCREGCNMLEDADRMKDGGG